MVGNQIKFQKPVIIAMSHKIHIGVEDYGFIPHYHKNMLYIQF